MGSGRDGRGFFFSFSFFAALKLLGNFRKVQDALPLINTSPSTDQFEGKTPKSIAMLKAFS